MYSYTGGDSQGVVMKHLKGEMLRMKGGIWVELGDSGKNNVM